MTASSIASVSLDPPLLLVCVDRRHDMHAALETGDYFALNVLAADQEWLSRRFAGSVENRFDGVGYRDNKQGTPIIDGAAATIECRKHATAPGGDHTVFVGLVTGGSVTDRRPLIYYRGGYGSL